MPYQGSCSLNIDTTSCEASAACNSLVLTQSLMRPVRGDTSELIPHTISQIVDRVKTTRSTVTLVKSYPRG